MLLSISVDCYHTHIQHLLCKKYHIRAIGFSSSFLDNYTFLTSFGELTKVDNNEVFEGFEKYLSKYIPSYMEYFKATNLSSLNRYVRSILRFFVSKVVAKFSHYEMSRFEQSISISPPAFPWLFKCHKNLPPHHGRSPILYIPLQLYPEHNTDYWLPQELIDYQTCILNIIKDISALDIYDKILIKDHPAVRGLREREFMLDLTKQCENNSKIFLLDSRIGQNLILRSYPGIHVLSLNSSASHEAILAGKTVITHESSVAAQILSSNQAPLQDVLPHSITSTYGLRVFQSDIKPSKYLLEMSQFHLKGYCSETQFSIDPQKNMHELEMVSHSLRAFVQIHCPNSLNP